MDYYHFLEEFDTYNNWNRLHQKKGEDEMWGHKNEKFEDPPFIKGLIKDGVEGASGADVIKISDAKGDDIWMGESLLPKSDRVNSPSHYTSGKTEVIDIIEDAIKDAPSAQFGMLQGQVLKYMLRVWLKDNPLEDMKKARWYLDRMINHYTDYPGDNPAPYYRG